MRHFINVGSFDPLNLLLQLERHPELWNQFNNRTTRDVTAHDETSDIWVRYRPFEQITSLASYNEPFAEMTWYPAYYALPDLRPVLLNLMTRLGGVALGGVLLTRIPAGKVVKTHTDKGVWHAEYYNTKVYGIIKANEQCYNMVEDETLVMRPGECWVFDNTKLHGVVNDGDEERIALIVSMKCE